MEFTNSFSDFCFTEISNFYTLYIKGFQAGLDMLNHLFTLKQIMIYM